MLFQRKVLCLCLNPGYDSTSKVLKVSTGASQVQWQISIYGTWACFSMGLGPVFGLWDLGRIFMGLGHATQLQLAKYDNPVLERSVPS